MPGVGGKQLLSPECLPVTAAFPGEGATRAWQGLLGSSSHLGLQMSEGFCKAFKNAEASVGWGPLRSLLLPVLASEPQMVPGWGWSLGGEVGQDQLSSSSRSPGAQVLGPAQEEEGACLPSIALPDLSVAESRGALAP